MRKMKELPTREYLLECFRYDRELGKIFWKERPRHHFKREGNYKDFISKFVDKEACGSGNNCLIVKLEGSVYKIHRIIWKLEYDEDCTEIIEHIDGDYKNNKITNLRKYVYAWESKKEELLENSGNNRGKENAIRVRETDSTIKELPTQQYLKECFDYDENIGSFTWRERPRSHFNSDIGMKISNSRVGGKIAGTLNITGYVHVKISDSNYSVHRLIWKWYYGVDPINFIDHINCIKNDNRLCNLREADRSENGVNRNVRNDSKTGHTGIYYCNHHKKYLVRVRIDKKSKFIGYFNTLEEAVEAKRLAAIEYFGEYNPNK